MMRSHPNGTLETVPRTVSAPARALPLGACDSHAHVFGPFERFPLYPGRRYEPPQAPAEDYLSMLDRVGSARGVLVHPSASGWDCSCTLNALALGQGRLRGIVVVPPDVSDSVLHSMQDQGVRGIRFTESGNQRSEQRHAGILGFNDFGLFSARLRSLGWHAQIWAKCEMIVAAAPEMLRCGIPLVVDHMGFCAAVRGVTDAVFQEFLSLVREGGIWVKLVPSRVSKQAPHYQDVRPFHEALLTAAPDRMIWGSDWPYIGLDPSPPDVGAMVDVFDSFIANDSALRYQVFVKNPAALYGF